MRIGKRTVIKTPKAAKQYVCALCGDLIEKGEHYQRATAAHEGRYLSIVACILHQWRELHERMRELKEQHNPKSIKDGWR